MLTLLLLTIGVIMVLSSSFARAYAQGKSPTYYFVRQAAFAVAGVVAMILLSKVRMVTYRRLSLLVLGVSIFLLAVVWIPHIGTRVNGARRWLSLGFTTFQPSEIAKIAVVLFFSSMICTYKEQMQTFRYGVVPFMVVTVIIVGLLMLEPHLSASIIIMALAIVMMFVGGIKLSYLLVGMGSAGALLLIASKFVPYVHKRIVSWRDPFADTSAAGYQIVQSLYSIGSGGFLGLGLGQSRQKYLYLPEEHNDYIFSIVCEELGYVGAIAILILFALLICRGYWIAAHSPDRYSFLVGIGITTLLSIQVFLNIAVVTNLIPCTGISLPFFSYGGTALLMQLGEMGIILSISRDIPTKKSALVSDFEEVYIRQPAAAFGADCPISVFDPGRHCYEFSLYLRRHRRPHQPRARGRWHPARPDARLRHPLRRRQRQDGDRPRPARGLRHRDH